MQGRLRTSDQISKYLAGVLKQGAERVAPVADSTVELVKQRMGLYTAAG